MTQTPVRFSMILPALLVLALPLASAVAQTTSPKPTTSTTSTAPATGAATNITGSDPTPIKWPPSAKSHLVIE